MFGAHDDFVLQSAGEIVEIVAVTCDADDEVGVILGVSLSVEESLAVADIELDVMAAEPEIAAYQLGHIGKPLFALDGAGSKFLIEQSAAGGSVIHFGAGFKHGGRTLDIRALRGRNALGKGL